MHELVARAQDIARRAHAGQTDKAGLPYIQHVARVAAAVADDPQAESVAWLHDVLEDCSDWVRAHASEFTVFPGHILDAVQLLTRSADTPDAAYYAGIRHNQLALRVKMADIADNSAESRLVHLDAAAAERLRHKYRHARQALQSEDG